MLFPASERSRCQYCRIMHGQESWTQRKCLDCIGTPGLCQTVQRDCHSAWHYPSFDRLRNIWFDSQLSRQKLSPDSSQAGSSSQVGPLSHAGSSTQTGPSSQAVRLLLQGSLKGVDDHKEQSTSVAEEVTIEKSC